MSHFEDSTAADTPRPRPDYASAQLALESFAFGKLDSVHYCRNISGQIIAAVGVFNARGELFQRMACLRSGRWHLIDNRHHTYPNGTAQDASFTKGI